MNLLLPRLGLLCVALAFAGCVNQQVRDRAAVEQFMQATSGSWRSDGGADLTIIPVRARMVTDEAIFVERRDANGVFVRLLDLKMDKSGKKVMQRALAFTQEGQWRDLREQPELSTALLPKDVRPAGTCDIQVAADTNSLTYSCGGSAPETFQRAR
jgi:hypothetical protein